MKFSVLGALVALFVMTAGAQAATECRAPYAPDVPDAFETEEQLMEVYGQVKDFITVQSPAYLECLNVMRSEVDSDAEDSDAQMAAIDQMHNDNVDLQTAVNNRFKVAYGKWKEENPKE